MAEIRVLDKHTAELIAAGEVVERPASVAKELLENAIDAGATQITLSAVRGGISQLQIVDNGSGIEVEYIDKAFIRHATSKISTAEDLNHIHTLGFRGEALAHPEISFRFLRDGKQQFLTPGDGDLRSAVYAVLGREFARDLLAVEGESGVYRVTGLITPPRACRASRGAQHFFVNGRYVKNRTMMAALENAYKGTMMQGKFPGAVLMLEMPADLVDVNVHPAKTEIRFARESDVFDAVYRAVRTALTTPGSGECRFELHESAPAKKEAPLQPALRGQTAALARAVPAGRLLACYDFIDELTDRVSRNAASAAVTCALTSDVYRICFQ